MSRVFSRLDEKLQEIIAQRGWTPTPIQDAAIPALDSGSDALIIAPTGSGKTMAVTLPILNRIISNSWEGLSILYITPLRALNRDIDRRLVEVAESVGLRVSIRHGDTSQSERQKQVRKPPNLLITTPETFQLMFTGHRLRGLLSTVKAVVVDEVHDIAASERGWQLSLGISRLEHLAGRTVQKIGLSATVGNPDEVASWLSKTAKPIIADIGRETQLLVETELPSEQDDVGAVELSISPSAHATLRKLANTVRSDSPCLVFVNSRNSAETIANRLRTIASDLEIGVHHGSLAASTRSSMEEDLREGRIHALVCTSSLELGIDVGSINRIIQVRSPRSADRMLQRVGRSDHRLGGIGKGHLLSWEVDDLTESGVIAKRAMAGAIEPVSWRTKPVSIAANQLILMTYSQGAIPIDEATEIIANTHQFKGWDRNDTIDVLQVLNDSWLCRLKLEPAEEPWWNWPAEVWAEAVLENKPEQPPRGTEEISEDLRKIQVDVPKRFAKGWFSRASRTRKWVQTNLSMIPDKQSYLVRDAVSRKALGNVDEAFVLSLDDSGDEEDGRPRRFVMAGRTWLVIDADPEREELLVTPVSDVGSAPHWVGELPPTPQTIAREIGELRRNILEDVQGIGKGVDYPLDGNSSSIIAQSVIEHYDLTGHIPDHRTITIEDRDEAIVINSCNGTQVNEAIGHLLMAMASTKTGRWGRIIVEATRIGLQAGNIRAEEVKDWLESTPPAALRQILSVTLPNSRQVRWRFAQVAKTFGIIRHGVDPRKINMTSLVRKYRGTVVMEEVLDKLFHERMDVEGASKLLQEIVDGDCDVVITAAGPLGLSSKSEKDLLLPNWSNAEVRNKLEHRLMNERAVLCCLNCGAIKRFRVGRMPEIRDATICSSCSGRMLACMREGLQKQLEEAVASEEEKDRDRMQKNAQAVANRGMEAILCLMGRGVGEATTQRLLRKVSRGNIAGLLEAIHIAEVEYARTRRFWN